jgi:hypothetical protein
VSVIEEKVKGPNGDYQARIYHKGKFLGKGGFAKCYELYNPETKTTQACKLVAKASLTKSRAK